MKWIYSEKPFPYWQLFDDNNTYRGYVINLNDEREAVLKIHGEKLPKPDPKMLWQLTFFQTPVIKIEAPTLEAAQEAGEELLI